MDAAFKAFQSQTGLEEFKGFAFELQTCACQYFERNNIKEYLGLIFGFQGGKEACQTITHYIIIVLSKYLRMMAAFHVYKMDEDALAADYEFFNSSYDNILAVFREVTGEQFVAGNLPSLESVKKSLQNPKQVEKYKALHNYTGEYEDELNLEVGQASPSYVSDLGYIF